MSTAVKSARLATGGSKRLSFYRTLRPADLALAGVLILIPALPLCFVLIGAGKGSSSFHHIADILLADMVRTTFAIVGLATFGATLLGTILAWIITAYRFKGRHFFSWALALPLAVPAYVAAYAWGDLTGARGFWIGILVYVTTLFPYVYLAARSAFEAQSVCSLEAGRLLGAGPWRRFTTIALPLARPAIAAGAALVGLEIAGDYGAADHLGISTLTSGIFKAWFSFGDLAAAARLSCLLLVIVLALVWIERKSRRGKVGGGSIRWRVPARESLSMANQAVLSGLCGLVLVISILIPLGHLVRLGAASGAPARDLSGPIFATASLCVLGVGVTLISAALSAFATQRSKFLSAIVHASALAGYSTPGAVTALGILATLTVLGTHVVSSLAGPFAIIALCYAYCARFTAAGLEPMAAGLEKTTRSMKEAATTLGASPIRRFWRLEAPLAAPSTFAAALIIAVEITKELPATTLLRPFGFDTLAVRAHAYAADERLGAAAWPALAIVLIALVPTILFSYNLSKSRAGHT